MTPQEVNGMIESVGIPAAYYQFADGTEQSTPFICFFYGNSNDFGADDTNYVRVERLYIELYTDAKDFVLERRIESILNDHDLFFTRSEVYIDEEHLHETIYETELILEVENA